ncbi:MAG: TetR/AcrR family transcriptional regulator [Ahrensia sp.]|nr:TetR/AcrR family transcriptional regulator [Ahrensia sp.]
MANRLTRDDWLAHGFSVLETIGHDGLKADKMVSALGVSRGSFYWHFENVDVFHELLAAQWRKSQIELLLGWLNNISFENATLQALIGQVLAKEHRLEAAMRHWAAVNDDIKATIDEIDRLRMRYMQHFLMQRGVSEAGAAARALFLNAAFIGALPNLSQGRMNNSDFANQIAKIILSPELKLKK